MPKMRVKLGNAEFEADGSEPELRALLDGFRLLLKERAAEVSQEKPETPTTDPATAPVVAAPEPVAQPPPEDEGLPVGWERVYRVDDKGIVSMLRAVPESSSDKEGDLLILLIFGFARLANEPEARATRLIAALRASGKTMDRIDRVLGSRTREIHKIGVRKGTKYTLNNPGFDRAKELLREMLAK